MTSIEDLEKQVDAILKRNDEADLENKINKEHDELISEWQKQQLAITIGFIILTAILIAWFVYTSTIMNIKTNALAAQNITEYITSLKAI